MKVKCPDCSAEFSLASALGVDAGRSALLAALAMPAPLGKLLARYLGLFRAAGRALSFDRVERLLNELEPMLSNQTVVRDGRTLPCSLAVWQRALELVLEHRDNGKLRLPLKTHGYLLEIAVGLADSVEAKAERQVEAERRTGQRREIGEQQLQRIQTISRVRGDIQLGLINLEQGREQLRQAGINPETL